MSALAEAKVAIVLRRAEGKAMAVEESRLANLAASAPMPRILLNGGMDLSLIHI